MGRSKALLTHTDGVTTFVAHAVRTARAVGLTHVVVVGRHDDKALRDEVSREAAAFITNPDPDRGQLSSLLIGLDAAERDFGAQAIMVMPVDVPLVTSAGIGLLLRRAAASAAPIVRACAEGRHGHPVIFKRAVFEELRSAAPSTGARALIHGHPELVLDVDIGEIGAALDVDTPEDYRRAFGRPV